eukprot:SAG11_NODE_1378_length_5084_cov_3.339619_7_plen_194_part_00
MRRRNALPNRCMMPRIAAGEQRASVSVRGQRAPDVCARAPGRADSTANQARHVTPPACASRVHHGLMLPAAAVSPPPRPPDVGGQESVSRNSAAVADCAQQLEAKAALVLRLSADLLPTILQFCRFAMHFDKCLCLCSYRNSVPFLNTLLHRYLDIRSVVLWNWRCVEIIVAASAARARRLRMRSTKMRLWRF